MRRYGLPVLPAVIGVLLGPNAEQRAGAWKPDARDAVGVWLG
ncbi:hypothetical protein ACF1G5_22525 [Streptomyces coeruleorubidus]